MIAVIGEALIDLVPGAGPGQFVAHPGGSPFNVAVGCARLEVPTALFARLSDTAFGRQLRTAAEAEGLDLTHAINAGEPTTLAVVSLDSQARATYDFYVDGTADWQWTTEELSGLATGRGGSFRFAGLVDRAGGFGDSRRPRAACAIRCSSATTPTCARP